MAVALYHSLLKLLLCVSTCHARLVVLMVLTHLLREMLLVGLIFVKLLLVEVLIESSLHLAHEPLCRSCLQIDMF